MAILTIIKFPPSLIVRVHYKEYLVSKINKEHLDPISLYNVNQLQAMLSREDKEQLAQEEEEEEEEYKKRLIKVSWQGLGVVCYGLVPYSISKKNYHYTYDASDWLAG